MSDEFITQSKAELRGRRHDLELAKRAHGAERQRAGQEIVRIDAALNSARVNEIEVTDHAVIRWLERREGHNIEAIRQELREVVGPADPAIHERVVEFEGLKLIVVDDRVVTVLEQHQRPKNETRKYVRVSDGPLRGPLSDLWAKLEGLGLREKPAALVFDAPPPSLQARIQSALARLVRR